MLTQVRPEFHEFHQPLQPPSNSRLLGFNLNNAFISNFYPHDSSRSSLASGSLIGSTLKARMDPGSQVWLRGSTGIIFKDESLKVNISVSRPGVASRPTDQPTPPRPTSNGLPVTVAHQPVKQPVQMAPQVSPLPFRWSLSVMAQSSGCSCYCANCPACSACTTCPSSSAPATCTSAQNI